MPSPELPPARPSDGIRYARSLTAADVGRRVVIRHRLGTGQHSDVLGVLTSWDRGQLVVQRRDGSSVPVQESAVVAAKVVPAAVPGPPSGHRP